MEKCHQTNDTADCTQTHYEWNEEMKRPVSKYYITWLIEKDQLKKID